MWVSYKGKKMVLVGDIFEKYIIREVNFLEGGSDGKGMKVLVENSWVLK